MGLWDSPGFNWLPHIHLLHCQFSAQGLKFLTCWTWTTFSQQCFAAISTTELLNRVFNLRQEPLGNGGYTGCCQSSPLGIPYKTSRLVSCFVMPQSKKYNMKSHTHETSCSFFLFCLCFTEELCFHLKQIFRRILPLKRLPKIRKQSHSLKYNVEKVLKC